MSDMCYRIKVLIKPNTKTATKKRIGHVYGEKTNF